jgi:ankyrin repeat protein
MSLDAPLLRSLLAQGWNPNRVLDTDQNAALHDLMMVCERYPTHNPDTLVIVAKLLINAGADKRAANKFGDTPLSIASSPRYCGPGHPVTALLR